MSKFIINGGKPLFGEVEISGAKNAALKMIPACILSDNSCVLENVPDILDTRKMLEIIQKMGAKTIKRGHLVQINTSQLRPEKVPDNLINSIRASVVIVGPLLARFGKAVISQPGGDIIGARPIDTHIDAFKKMGVRVYFKNGHWYFEAKKLKGQTVVLNEMSVTATENIMMAAVLAEGETEIRVAAAEPEIEDLANFLNKMGARIQGAGTHVIRIKGVKKLKGASHKIMPDRIEAGTFTILGAISGGEIRVKNIIPEHLDMLLNKLQEAGVDLKISKNSLVVRFCANIRPLYIDTRPYPGFSTDLQAPMAVFLTQARGKSHIFETLFEGRFNYVKELVKMGAKIKIMDPHNLVIDGPTALHGCEITSYDIRAGATLVLAALVAKGISTIENIELIDRGYEKLEEKLLKLGADIKRVV